jgi:hypothetical protein
MSLYYFHIRDGRHLVPDEEGLECRNILAAKIEAQASARDLREAALHSFMPVVPATVEVEDEDGNQLGEMAPKFSVN